MQEFLAWWKETGSKGFFSGLSFGFLKRKKKEEKEEQEAAAAAAAAAAKAELDEESRQQVESRLEPIRAMFDQEEVAPAMGGIGRRKRQGRKDRDKAPPRVPDERALDRSDSYLRGDDDDSQGG